MVMKQNRVARARRRARVARRRRGGARRRPTGTSRSRSRPRTARSRSRRSRCGSSRSRRRRPRMLFAIGAGKQVVAVDDQSNYPATRAAHEALRLHAERRGDRGLQARPRRRRGRLERRSSTRFGSSASRARSSTRRDTSPTRTRRSGSSARRRATAREATARRRADADADRRDRCGRVPTARARAADRLPRARPDLLLGDVETFIGRVYALFGLQQHRRRRRHDGLGGYPQLSARVHRRREPGPDRARRHEVLRPERRDGRSAAGLEARSPRCGTGTSSRVDDDIASRWGPRVVDFVRAVAGSARRGAKSWTPRASPAGAVALPGLARSAGRSRRRGVRRAARRRARRAGATSASARSSASALARCRSSTCTRRSRRRDEAILWELRAPRVVLGRARRRDAGARRRVVPGRVPQPARRPVPARRRRRRRARRDARDRVRRADGWPATCCRSRRSSARRSRVVAAYALGRSAGGAGDGDARPRGRHGRRVPHRGADVRAAAALGHAAGGLPLDPRPARRPRAGATSCSCCPYIARRARS